MTDTLWIIGTDLAEEFSLFHAEIRALDPNVVCKMISVLGIFKDVTVLHQDNTVDISISKIITVSESVSRKVAAKYFPQTEVILDTVFLRYDEANVKSLKVVDYDYQSSNLFDSQMMALAFNEAEKSSDWWRHVGTVLVKEKQVVAIAHNNPVPSEHTPYVFGNPRDFIEAGKLSHFSDVLHSEKAVFAEVLRSGICTDGADIYVSVFPCPDCAKLIAYSGIKRLFFGSGHASLDGQSVLKSKGVELVYVPV